MKIKLCQILKISFCSICYLSCNDNPEFGSKLSIKEDQIICENCYDFGAIIEANNNTLIVAEDAKIHFFTLPNQKPILSQTIEFSNTGGILSMVLDGDILYIGLADVDGTGSIRTYIKNMDKWEFNEELKIGKTYDNFGSSIDISDDFLVVGANAPYTGFWLKGSIYIFKRFSSKWELDTMFYAVNSSIGDLFGETVAIQNGYILAGSGGQPLHIFKHSDKWNLLRIEDILPIKIAHEENNFLIRDLYSIDTALHSFLLLDNGDFQYQDINLDIINDDDMVSVDGEIIEINNSYALIDFDISGSCALMEFSNDQWVNLTVFQSIEGIACTYQGLEITDNALYIGGRDDNSNNNKSYVILINL